MKKGRNPYILESARDDIRSLLKSSNTGTIRNFSKLIREMDAFVSVDESTGEKELLLADVLADAREEDSAKTRGYIVGEVSGYEYHVLTLGTIQSFASFVGETLVVLWFGIESQHEEQEQVKIIAASRLHNYLERTE